jgi:hypothetical protein
MKLSIHFAWGLGLIGALVGCGGGGGGSAPLPPKVAVSGVAVDGYLSNAFAFLDLNGNEKHDADEPSASTNERGLFSMSATAEQKASASVVIQAIAGQTTDMDQPGAPLSVGMTLIAPAGKPEVVSPLTTWVADTMRRENETLDQAKASVAAELGLSAEVLMQDFVADSPNGSPSDAYKVAVAMAEVLKSVPANADKEARMGHVATHMGSVTDAGRLSEIKSSDLSAIRALVKDRIAQNTLTLSLNDKWLEFLSTATSLAVKTERRFNNPYEIPPGGHTLAVSHQSGQITLAMGSVYSRTISFTEDGLQQISTTIGVDTETVGLQALSPHMPTNVASGDAGILFSKVASQKQIEGQSATCAKSTGSYTVTADSATSLRITLTIEESEVASLCKKFGAFKEVYGFNLTASGLSLQELTVYLSTDFGTAETLKLSF